MNSISTTTVALFFVYFACNEVFGAKSKYLIKLNDENWRDMLQGEWMINFFSKATWCPACKELERPWNAFADWSSLKNKKIKVAQVDVTENPSLSGRFLVSALPTIFHVKDGVFRLYGGPKDKEDFVKFIKQKQWSTVEPMASWFHPDSTQMSLVSALFKFSMKAKNFHHHLVDDKGVPSLAVFGLFAVMTLTVGCVLGLIMVLIIDQFVPSGKKGGKTATRRKPETKSGKESVAQKNGLTKNGAPTANGLSANNNQAKSTKADNQSEKQNKTPSTNGTTKSNKKKD